MSHKASFYIYVERVVDWAGDCDRRSSNSEGEACVGQNKLSVLPRKWRMRGEGHLTGAGGEKDVRAGFWWGELRERQHLVT